MTMRATLLSVFALLLSGFFMIAGHGIMGTLVPLRASVEGFSTTAIGLIGSAQNIGFVFGSLLGPMVVLWAGHIRSFATFAAIAASSVLVFAMVIQPLAWAGVRAVLGFCVAGMFMVIESWLNERSTNDNRGQVFSIYQIILLVGILGGQQILGAGEVSGFHLFSIAAILTALALVPVSQTHSITPAPVKSARPRILWLIGVSPMAVLGCGLVGMANGAIWSLAPVYARSQGYDITAVGWFMSAIILGSALAQWPVGRLSDRLDRRWVIVGASVASLVLGLVIFSLNEVPLMVQLGLVAAYGGASLTLYSLCTAHVNDLSEPEDFVDVSSGMLTMFGAGAIVGPFLASLLIEQLSFAALFLFTACVHGTIVAFCVYRLVVKPRLVDPLRQPFVVSLSAKPAPSTPALDPRSDPGSGDLNEGPDEAGDGEQGGT